MGWDKICQAKSDIWKVKKDASQVFLKSYDIFSEIN